MSLALLFAAVAAPASAQIVQSVAFGAGLFMPRGFDRRVDGDVLVANLSQPDVLPGVSGSLAFEIGDFTGMPVWGEWNVAINRRFEISAGLSYFTNKADSVYQDLVNCPFPPCEGPSGGTEIEQELRLTMVPISGVVRFLPLGDPTGIQPYVGGGVAAIRYTYTETGEFVDTSTFEIFADKYTAKGTAFGAIILGGVRFPLGGDVYGLTVEGRYQFADGKTGGADAGFLGDRIDLSGGTLNFGFIVRF
jgi:hypothetical protein